MHRICIAACAAVFLSLIAGCGSTRHLPATLKAQSFAPPANAAPAQNNGGGVTQPEIPEQGALDEASIQIG